MTSVWYLVEGINPEPWTAPTASMFRKGGRVMARTSKNEALRTYQQAIADEIAAEVAPWDFHAEGELELDVWFWRNLDQYRSDSGRLITRKRADRSNLLKAFEDALQGVAFKNDVQIVSGRTTIVKQSVGVDPRILFRLGPRGAKHDRAIGDALAYLDIMHNAKVYRLEGP